MCRNLFYTIDAVRMQAWISDEQPSRGDDGGRTNRRADPSDVEAGYSFLNDSQREDALRAWARGIVRHAPGAALVQTTVWVPPRHTVVPNCQVTSEAQASILARGQALTRGSNTSRTTTSAERVFMDSIKPLLGVWYGRLMLLRVGDLPWLIAQINPGAWIEWVRRGASNQRGLLMYPPPAQVLWRGADVVEMFGAEIGDLCCCSLVESANDPEVEALEADFLDALALTLTSSTEGTVLIDIDADYAE